MKYKVLIRRCADPQRAQQVAEEIARWSGSSAAVVTNALLQKSVCIKKEAEEAEALQLKNRFEGVGAVVELEGLGAPAAAASGVSSDYDEDEDDAPGRVLSNEEYADALKKRPDIFAVEKDRKLGVLEIVCLVIGAVFGVWLSTYEIAKVATDFFEKLPEERTAKIVKDLPETLKMEEKKEEEKKEEIKSDKKKLKQSKSKGAGGRTGGGGDPRARVTRKGVLGIISGQVKGQTVASADVFGKGGFASGIDAILQGVGGLKSGGGGGVGRKGAAGIGYGAGYGSGFGGGGGGIDDLLGNLMGGEDGGSLQLKKRGALKLSEPKFVSGGALTGGRSKASIMRVVMQNLAALR